jgi:hypothetical protein
MRQERFRPSLLTMIMPVAMATAARKGPPRSTTQSNVKSWVSALDRAEGARIMSAQFVRAGPIKEPKAKGRLVVRGAHRPILVVED